MGERADRIAEHIEQQHAEIRDNVLELTQKVRRSFDWRAQCEERPMTMIGLAVGGGILLSTLVGGRSRSSPEERPYNAPDWRPDFERNANAGSHLVADTWDGFRAALVGLAVTKLKTFVDELLPGFQEEYRKAAASRTPGR
jgi:hypothetical protein